MLKRILLKLSGELFKSENTAVDLERVLQVAKEVEKIKKDYELGIVFGGGNIFRGRDLSDLKLNMTTAHFTGMTATLVNALAIKNVFDGMGIENRIISALSFPQVVGVSSQLDINRYLSQGEIVIFAGGTGNPFMTNDTNAVIRALEMKVGVILKATNVQGVYDKDPKIDYTAKQFKKLRFEEYLKIPGAFVFDRTAAVLAEENNLSVYIFKWEKGSLKKAVKLRAGGTLIK